MSRPRSAMRPIWLVAAVWLAALPAAAGSPIEKVPEGKDIPVAQWIAMAAGRTLTYRTPDGELFALEQYHPGGNRVSLQFRDGTCFRGTWDYARPRYCYHWDGQGTVCFRHVRSGSTALIIQQTDDGTDSSFLQLMTEVSDAALACGPPLIGQGPTLRMVAGGQ